MNTKTEETQIMSIEPEQWQELFELVPELEHSKEFGQMEFGEADEEGYHPLPHYVSSRVVDRFVETCYDIGIVVSFDWPGWDEGRVYLENPETDFSKLDLTTLCKLITVIIRSDKFSGGNLASAFEYGIMFKILEAIKKQV